jgi:hypothetical protein
MQVSIMFEGCLGGLYSRELLAEQRKLFPVDGASATLGQSGPRNDDGAAADANERDAAHAAFPEPGIELPVWPRDGAAAADHGG